MSLSDTRICHICGETKLLWEFSSTSSRYNYRDRVCRKCRNFASKLRRIARAEYFEKVSNYD